MLVVGRGSTDPDANADVVKTARLLWEGRDYPLAETAFVSLARPDVAEGLERCRRLSAGQHGAGQHGPGRIVVARYFLFPGVLPDRVTEQAAQYAAAHPELDIAVAGVLGDCDEIAALVFERYREALSGDIRMNCDMCVYRIAHARLRAPGRRATAPPRSPARPRARLRLATVDPYLLGLRLEGRRVLVVGGGGVASRRVPALLDAGAEVLLVSPKVAASLEGLAAAGRIRWAARGYQAGDCAGAWLVCACTDDPGGQRGRRGGGRGPADLVRPRRRRHRVGRLDARVRSRGRRPGGGAQRGPDPRGPPAQRRRSATRSSSGLQSGRLSARHGRGHRGGVAIIGGGPGDPGLITVRGRELLAEADVVLTDRLAPRSLLDELRDDVEIIDAGKIPYGRAMAQEHINAALVSHARAGRFVARLKGGDPFVFGRGAEEVLACLRAGVPVTVVPGVTSAVAVPASAWVPVTHRGVAQEFHVVSVHVAPGDERSTVNWKLLGWQPGTLVLLMAVERLGAVVGRTVAIRTQSGYSRFGNRRRYSADAAHN